MVIVKGQLHFEHVHVGDGGEIYSAEGLRRTMSPRADNHPCCSPGFRGGTVLSHAHVTIDSTHQEDIEPAAIGVSRDFYFIKFLLITDRLPISVIALVLQPVSIMLDGSPSTLQI